MYGTAYSEDVKSFLKDNIVMNKEGEIFIELKEERVSLQAKMGGEEKEEKEPRRKKRMEDDGSLLFFPNFLLLL